MRNRLIKNKKKSFVSLIFSPIIFSLIGLFFIFEASAVKSFREFGDGLYYFKLQLIWFGLGLLIMFFLANFDYRNLYYLSFFFMIGTIFLLFLVLIPNIGHQVGGARRWLDLGFFNIQPTELAKFSTIVYLASWFSNKERKRFFSFLILLSLLVFLIILQPDMGTTIIIFLLSVTIYFLAGNELYYLLLLLPISFLGFFLLIKIAPYRFNRILAFLNPQLDPYGISYHLNQILISLSNGRLLGTGFGGSRQKYLFLPEAHTDSIFAIIAEEIGFIGSSFLLFFFLYFFFQIYQIFEKAPDRLAKLLSGGVFLFFNLQVLINLGGVVNLFPLTGVPLPFISYGGSNLLVSFALIGILINIAKKERLAIN
ncbi:MAG: putative lipid II flippase FtsW [Patescibacteria group bacterium]|nr:putative lipid II flippase FtsW [Patescibacteria group bacterium]